MFTGIIQTLGQVVSSTVKSGDILLVIKTDGFNDETIALGDSIACNGVCLTVIKMAEENGARLLSFDVSKESIDKSLIGSWKSGQQLNMELAMLPTTRFGGHIVSGHVDGLGELIKLEQDARSWRLWFKPQTDLSKYIAKKGSITIDGISLTVNDIEGDLFHVNIVPHTMQVTTLGDRLVGDKVHLEIDVVARYLERLLQTNDENPNSISLETLAQNGYVTK